MTMRGLCISLLLLLSPLALAGYTTPNTAVHWTLDSLVTYSAGTLTGSFPNYALNDTLTVAPNDMLTMRPGSVISVAQGAGKGFTILGILRAMGTLTDTIVLKGIAPAPGSHRGFRFEDSAVDSMCVIAFCRIQDAVEGIHCLNASPLITNTLFTNNSSNGVRCFAASPHITNCTFVENFQSAITANVNSSPLIEWNVFARNNSQNSGPRNQIAIGGQGANNPIIRDNEIYNQTYFRAGGISLVTLTGSDICNAIVENNSIHDNSFGIVVQGLSAGGTLRPIIRNNRIENNRINPDPLVSGSGIAIYTGGPTNAPVISGNVIKNNYWGITCVSGSGLSNSPRPNIGDLGTPDTSDDGWNIFINNNNGGTVYQFYNNGTQNIQAQNNYWGSSDPVTVESFITHRPDSAVFGLVNYNPYGIRGLGRPDTFTVQQINGTQVRLTWRFPAHSSPASIRLMHGTDSLHFFPITILSDAETAFVMNYTPLRWYYGLSSFNRFGEGDTAIRFAPSLQPSVRLDGDQPKAYALYQNHPNPFNPATTMLYDVPVESYVRLDVINTLGQTITTLVNDRQSGGRYSAQWNAEGYSSGVYYYRMSFVPATVFSEQNGQPGAKPIVKKLVLLK